MRKWFRRVGLGTIALVAIIVPQSPIQKTAYVDAGAFSVDATTCLAPAERTINSGPKKWMVNCGTATTGIIYFALHLPTSWTGGTVRVILDSEVEDATPVGALVMNVSCQCRGTRTAINATWGSAVANNSTYSVQYAEEFGTGTAITPNGDCTRGAMLFCRLVQTTSTTVSTTNHYILGLAVQYPAGSLTDPQ